MVDLPLPRGDNFYWSFALQIEQTNFLQSHLYFTGFRLLEQEIIQKEKKKPTPPHSPYTPPSDAKGVFVYICTYVCTLQRKIIRIPSIRLYISPLPSKGGTSAAPGALPLHTSEETVSRVLLGSVGMNNKLIYRLVCILQQNPTYWDQL